jgi:hypothetical protein
MNDVQQLIKSRASIAKQIDETVENINALHGENDNLSQCIQNNKSLLRISASKHNSLLVEQREIENALVVALGLEQALYGSVRRNYPASEDALAACDAHDPS